MKRLRSLNFIRIKKNRKSLSSFYFILLFVFLLNSSYGLIVQHEKTIYYEFNLPIIIPINLSESYDVLNICYVAKVSNAKKECVNFICQKECVYNLTLRQNILFTNYTLEISTPKEKKLSEFEIVMPTKPLLKFEKFDFLEVSELLQQYNLTNVFVFNTTFSTVWYKQDSLKFGFYYNDSSLVALDEKEAKTKEIIKYSFLLSKERYDFLASKNIDKIYFVIFWNNENIYQQEFVFKALSLKETIEDEIIEDFENVSYESLDYSDFKIMKMYEIERDVYEFFKRKDFELITETDKTLEKFQISSFKDEKLLAIKSKAEFLKNKIDKVKQNYTITFRDVNGKKVYRADLFKDFQKNLCDLEIERKDKAKVKWEGCFDLDNFDIGLDIVFDDKIVIVNSKKVSFLNRSAIITIYNYTEDGLYIFKDGNICNDCQLINFDKEKGIVEFKVHSFSTYEVGFNVTINLFGWNVQNTWFGVSGFRLNTTTTGSTTNQYHLLSGNYNIHYGMRVFVINDSDPATWRELTSGTPYLLFSKYVGDTSTSYQTAYWNCPGIDDIFNNSLYILIYGQIDSDNNPATWQDTATWGLIYEPFLAVKLFPTQWNITLYTRRRYTTSTYVYFYSGSTYAQFRNLTIGYAKINVSFVSPTPPNNSEISTLDLSVVASGSPIFKNLTVNIYNSSGNLVRTNFTTLNELNWTIDDLADGVYYVNATAFDALGYSYYSETRRYVVDRSIPYIILLDPTPNDEQWFKTNTIIINVSVQSTNFGNSTIWIYDKAGDLSKIYISYVADYWKDFVLEDGFYFFNVTAFSATGKFSTTETRKIYIDTIKPQISINSPENNSLILADFIIVNYSVIEDNLEHIEIKLYDSGNNILGSYYLEDLEGEVSFAGLSTDNYTIIATAYDNAGNFDSVSIVVRLDASTLDFCDFGYYRNISISNSVSAVSNYTIRVVIDTQSLISQNKMKSDCSDVRFTDSDGITPISYWLEPNTCNTTNTVFWVKIPDLPLGNKIIYMFYYSPSLITASNLYKAFEIGYAEPYSWFADSSWGSGGTNSGDPYNTAAADVRDQVIYLRSSFQNYEPILIEQIAFRRYQAPGIAIANFRLRYQFTTSTSFPTASFTSGGWILFYGPVTHTPVAEWNYYSGKPFLWIYNNFMLDISKDDSVTANNGGMYRKNIGVSNILCYFSGTRTWPFDGTCTRSNFVPTIRFYGLVRKKLSTEPSVTVNSEIPIYDICLPDVIYNAPANNSFLNYNNILLNATPWYPTLRKLTVFFYGDGNHLVNYTEIQRGTPLTYLWQNLFTEKLYNWTVIVSDGIRNSTESFMFFTIDTTKPLISFESPTPANDSYSASNQVTINVSVVDLNFNNVTIYLYNTTGLVEMQTSTDNPFSYTFTNLPEGLYYVNATGYDKAGNYNSTETRKFTIDVTKPLISFESP
ncbi:MAG: DUF2341 domain-containing protein, partial [Candidatus Woesearchaeota archaeon]